MTPVDLGTLEQSVTLEEVGRNRVHAPAWQVRRHDEVTAEQFAEILAEDPAGLPPPDYVLDPSIEVSGAGGPGVLIGTGYVRSVATFVILQRPTIVARVWRTDGDAEELAFRLGLREDALGPRAMSAVEKIQNAIHFHELYPEASNREVARQVGLSHTKVDQLAREGWQQLPRTPRPFDADQTARRAVRALLDLGREVGTRNAGAWLGRAAWDLTPEGEELSTLQCFSRAIDRAGRYIEKEVGKT